MDSPESLFQLLKHGTIPVEEYIHRMERIGLGTIEGGSGKLYLWVGEKGEKTLKITHEWLTASKEYQELIQELSRVNAALVPSYADTLQQRSSGLSRGDLWKFQRHISVSITHRTAATVRLENFQIMDTCDVWSDTEKGSHPVASEAEFDAHVARLLQLVKMLTADISRRTHRVQVEI